MIPSIIGVLVTLLGLVLVYLAVHGHSKLLNIEPIKPVGYGPGNVQ